MHYFIHKDYTIQIQKKYEVLTKILTLKSDSEAIKSSNSRVAEEADGQTVRVVVVVVSSIIIFEINCPLLLKK